MKFLITGGAGFIGSHLTESLLADQHKVAVIDDFSTGSPENLSSVSGSPNLETMAEPRRARTNRTTSVMSSCSRSSMTANRDSLITLFLRIDV